MVGHARQTCQNLAQVSVGINASAAAAFDEGVENGPAFSGFGFADKEPVLLAQGRRADGVFDRILTYETASSTLSVSLGGQNLALTAWGSGPNYTDYAANIPSSEVGQTETLTITASGPTAINTIDAFEFSTQSVPDSDPFVLTGLGGTLFALYRRFAPKRCS